MKAEAGELFRFRFLTEVRFGVGVRNKLTDYIAELNANKIAIVFDQNAAETELIRETIERIASAGNTIQMVGPEKEPEIGDLEVLREKALAFGADAVCGIGGGSTLDMAKGLAAVLPNSKPAAEYQGFDKLEKRGLPCLLIPTLFGAGTEVTASAVMINREKCSKGGINGQFVFPTMAVIDPELGKGAPLKVMGATALDALVHCIEGYVAKCATTLSRMYSRQAALIIMPALYKLAARPDSVAALEDIAFSSLLAITGLMHSESGICGAISYPLGVHHRVPHGLAGGLVMPGAIQFNAMKGCDLYSDLITGPFPPITAADRLANHLSELISIFELPRLSSFGVTEMNLSNIAKEVFGFKAVLDMNPVKIDSPDIISTLIRGAL